MNAERALDRLPEAYAEALRLSRAGMGSMAIARRLDLSLEAVGPLLRLAEAKLAHLLEGDQGTDA